MTAVSMIRLQPLPQYDNKTRNSLGFTSHRKPISPKISSNIKDFICSTFMSLYSAGGVKATPGESLKECASIAVKQGTEGLKNLSPGTFNHILLESSRDLFAAIAVLSIATIVDEALDHKISNTIKKNVKELKTRLKTNKNKLTEVDKKQIRQSFKNLGNALSISGTSVGLVGLNVVDGYDLREYIYVCSKYGIQNGLDILSGLPTQSEHTLFQLLGTVSTLSLIGLNKGNIKQGCKKALNAAKKALPEDNFIPKL